MDQGKMKEFRKLNRVFYSPLGKGSTVLQLENFNQLTEKPSTHQP